MLLATITLSWENILKPLYILGKHSNLTDLVLQLGLLWVMNTLKWKIFQEPFKLIETLSKLIPKISGLGTDWDKLINYKICAITLFITTVKLFFRDQKIQECGTLWEVVTKKWIKITRLRDVMLGLKVVKTEKVLQFIKWANCTTWWGLNLNLKPYMHLNQT